jgi:hypothetical protein
MSQKHTSHDTTLLRCIDHNCEVMGSICCINCRQVNNCPNKCSTIQQYKNPEYEGCPHLNADVNTQRNVCSQHFYDTRVTLITLSDLSEIELKVLKRRVLEFLETQCVTGCVVVNPSRRQPE